MPILLPTEKYSDRPVFSKDEKYGHNSEFEYNGDENFDLYVENLKKTHEAEIEIMGKLFGAENVKLLTGLVAYWDEID